MVKIKLSLWLDQAEKLAREEYGLRGLTAQERITLASLYDDDVSVEQAVNEMFCKPPREAGES